MGWWPSPDAVDSAATSSSKSAQDGCASARDPGASSVSFCVAPCQGPVQDSGPPWHQNSHSKHSAHPAHTSLELSKSCGSICNNFLQGIKMAGARKGSDQDPSFITSTVTLLVSGEAKRQGVGQCVSPTESHLLYSSQIPALWGHPKLVSKAGPGNPAQAQPGYTDAGHSAGPLGAEQRAPGAQAVPSHPFPGAVLTAPQSQTVPWVSLMYAQFCSRACLFLGQPGSGTGQGVWPRRKESLAESQGCPCLTACPWLLLHLPVPQFLHAYRKKQDSQAKAPASRTAVGDGVGSKTHSAAPSPSLFHHLLL